MSDQTDSVLSHGLIVPGAATLPDPGDVRAGVVYGVAGSELTGTLVVLGEVDIETGDTPALQCAAIAAAAGIGTLQRPDEAPTADASLFVGALPEGIGFTLPSVVVSFMDTGGRAPDAKWAVDRPTVQAIVRASPEKYKEGWLKARAVRDVLLGLTALVGEVRGITMRTDVFHLGVDESLRHLFSVNFDLIMAPEGAGNRGVLV